MKISIICVGKLKENYLKQAVEEYCKRLGRYAKVQILEVADEKTPDESSLADIVKQKEGLGILKKIQGLSDNVRVISLAIEGKQISSESLADDFKESMVSGVSHLCFVIGGSLGLSEEVLKASDYKLSFSKMTFPHQLMRVMLLEQVYRAFRIIHNEPYHK